MARIIIARPSGADRLEVDQATFDKGFYPGFVYVSDASGSPSSEPAIFDGAVAGLIPSASASATSAALRAAFGSLSSQGLRWVALGDSITSVDGGGSPGQGWVDQARLRSGGRVVLVNNAGVAGDNSANALARVQTDVVAYKPNLVTVLIGTNDISQSVPFATYKTNIKAIVAAIRTAGATVVLATIPPRNGADVTARKVATTTLWNSWLRRYARDNGCHLLDFYPPLVDPATGGYRTGLNFTDGIHLTPAGHSAMADVFINNLLPVLPVGAVSTLTSNVDPNNLVSNGLLLTDTSGWSISGTTADANVTETRITNDTDFAGSCCWEMALNHFSGFREFVQNASSAWSVGDVLAFSAKIKVVSSSGVASTTGAHVAAQFYGAASPTVYVAKNLSQPGLKGTAYAEITVPAGTTGPVQMDILLLPGGTGAAETIRVGELMIRNLTTGQVLV